MANLMKKKVVRVTCWELKSHPFKALVLLTFTYIIEIWGGDFKNSHEKELEKGMTIEVMSHVNVRFLTTYHIFMVEFGELLI
jgi:hypothetical protein